MKRILLISNSTLYGSGYLDHAESEIRDFLGVNSLGYLSLEGMLRAAGSANAFCHACFSGRYPVPVLPEDAPAATPQPLVPAPA